MVAQPHPLIDRGLLFGNWASGFFQIEDSDIQIAFSSPSPGLPHFHDFPCISQFCLQNLFFFEIGQAHFFT
jgi:hypothetical protein